MSKLSLGTVQFGLNYGVSNKNGKISLSEAKKILQLAKDSNIDLIDTAISYGDSEKVIGDIGIKDFKFVSKLPDLPSGYINVDAWVEENVKSSIKRLGINSLYGLLIHKTENLLDNKGKKLISSLNRMKNDGKFNQNFRSKTLSRVVALRFKMLVDSELNPITLVDHTSKIIVRLVDVDQRDSNFDITWKEFEALNKKGQLIPWDKDIEEKENC